MMRLAFAQPWRLTEGLLRSVTTLLGLSLDVPDHTTLSRRSAALSLVTALAAPAGPVTVMIDGTGLKVFGAGEWQMAKNGGRDRRTWRKLHLAIDPDPGEVLASALTTTEEGDASLVRPLLCRFLDDSITSGAACSDGRHPKSARARSRGEFGRPCERPALWGFDFHAG